MRYVSACAAARSLGCRLARAAVPGPHALALPLPFCPALRRATPRVSTRIAACTMRRYTRLAAWPLWWRRGSALLLHRQRVWALRLVALELHVRVHARRCAGLKLQRVPLVRRHNPPILLRRRQHSQHMPHGARTQPLTHRRVPLLLRGQLQADAGAVHEQNGHALHLQAERLSLSLCAHCTARATQRALRSLSRSFSSCVPTKKCSALLCPTAAAMLSAAVAGGSSPPDSPSSPRAARAVSARAATRQWLRTILCRARVRRHAPA